MPDYEELGIKKVNLNDSKIALPIDVQARFAKTVQTHNGVTIPAGTWNSNQAVTGLTNANGFIDCDDFDDISATLVNSAATATTFNIEWSHDGIAVHGEETILGASGTSAVRAPNTISVRAKYARAKINNGDTSARTVSAWLYLKT